MNRKFFYIYPHHEGKSIRFEFSRRRFLLFKAIVFLFFVGIIYFSFFHIQLIYSLFVTEQENSRLDKQIALNSEIIKNYSITYAVKKKYLDKNLDNIDTIGVVPEKKLKNLNNQGVGGASKAMGKSEQLIRSYGEKLIDNKILAFENNEIDYFSIIDQDLSDMDSSLSLVRNLNIQINERKNFIYSLPTLSPVLGDYSSTVLDTNEDNTSLKMYLTSRPQTIISTAQGKIKDIVPLPNLSQELSQEKSVEKSEQKFSIVIQHDFGFITYYIGVELPKVKINDLVEKAENIGTAKDVFTYRVKIGNRYVNPSDFVFIDY